MTSSTRFISWLFVLAAISCPFLSAQKRSAKEWRTELGKRYNEAAGFIATYEGHSPGKPDVTAVVAEDSATGAALLKVTLEGVGNFATMWFVPDEKKGAFWFQADGKTVRIEGYGELLKQFEKISQIFKDEEKEGEDSVMRSYLFLNRTTISFGIGANPGDQGAPWFDERLLDEVEEVREEDGAVKFVQKDGDWFSADPKTGRLLEQVNTGENGKRTLKLIQVKELGEAVRILELAPEVDPAEVETESVGDAAHGYQLHQTLYLFLAKAAHLAKVEAAEFDAALQERREQLVQYWTTALQGKLPAGFPKTIGEKLRKDVVLPLHKHLQESVPEAREQLTIEKTIELGHDKLVSTISRILATRDDLVGPKRMKQFLEHLEQKVQGGEAEDGRLATAPVITRHLFEAYCDALAEQILVEIKRAGLD